MIMAPEKHQSATIGSDLNSVLAHDSAAQRGFANNPSGVEVGDRPGSVYSSVDEVCAVAHVSTVPGRSDRAFAERVDSLPGVGPNMNLAARVTNSATSAIAPSPWWLRRNFASTVAPSTNGQTEPADQDNRSYRIVCSGLVIIQGLATACMFLPFLLVLLAAWLK